MLLYCRKHPKVAELIRREVGAAAEAGGDRKSEAAKDQGSNTTLIDRGATYALRRLKRDHPELSRREVGPRQSTAQTSTGEEMTM